MKWIVTSDWLCMDDFYIPVAISSVEPFVSQSGHRMVALPPLEQHEHTIYRRGVPILHAPRLTVL